MSKQEITKLFAGNMDESVIEKQRQAHIGIMLHFIHDAGEAGVTVEDLKKKTEAALEVFEDADRARWTKCSLQRHVSWLVKKYGCTAEYVEVASRKKAVKPAPYVKLTGVPGGSALQEAAPAPEPQPEEAEFVGTATDDELDDLLCEMLEGELAAC